MLKFHVGSRKARKQARAKIDRLAQVVNDYRGALIKEIELIDNAGNQKRKGRQANGSQ